MNMNEYQQKALRTWSKEDKDRDEMILNGVMGMCGEAGECIDLVKKCRFQGHELNEEKLLDELGDVLWYIAVAARGIGKDLEEVAQHNVSKLLARYPLGFDEDRSRNREA